MMTSNEFVSKIYELLNYKTLYVNGAWGWPMSQVNKERAISRNAYNAQTARSRKIKAASSDTFGFDCVCMIKGVLWGWSGDVSKSYGGAGYNINGVPDINADQMIKVCQVFNDWTKIVPGAVVWKTGHIGVYVGGGLVVEATPIWKDGVQLTALNAPKPGYNYRTWTKWGLLPYIEYIEEDEMTYEDFKAFMERYEKELASKPASGYAKDAISWARSSGLMVGDAAGNIMPQSPIKRQDLVLMLYRQEQNKDNH